jgi:hypothetical protein
MAVMDYINECFLDSADKSFLAKPAEDEKDGDQPPKQDEEEETDIQVLLALVDELNDDFEAYLGHQLIDHKVILPTGKHLSMMEEIENYIFFTGMSFMKLALKRKTYDVGAHDMKFFTIADNIAKLFYSANKAEHKLSVYELLKFMNDSEKHSKYLDDVRHPAKKNRNNDEHATLKLNVEAEKAAELNLKGGGGGDEPEKASKSGALTLKMSQLILSGDLETSRERQFEGLVQWVVGADAKIREFYPADNPFENVGFNPIIGAIINLVDAKVLDTEPQLGGIKLLRKIVEVVNEGSTEPAADWDGDEVSEIAARLEQK